MKKLRKLKSLLKKDESARKETAYLESIPGLKESILKASKMPSSKFHKKLPW